MKIGIIGAGHIGQALAKKFTKAGYPVILSNSRGIKSLDSLVEALGPLATAGTNEDSANADIVVIAVRWETIPEVLQILKPQLIGKIIIDASNRPSDGNAKEETQPATAVVAALVPDAKVVKAFNTLYVKWLEADPTVGNGKRVSFISGDHPSANQSVAKLVTAIGFEAVDLGSLEQAAPIMDFGTALSGLNLVSYPN